MKTKFALTLASLVLDCLLVQGQVRVSDFGNTNDLYGGGSWAGGFTTDTDSGASFLRFGTPAGIAGQIDGRFGTVPDSGNLKRVVFRYRIDAQNNVSKVNFVLTDRNLQSCSASVDLNTQRTGWQYAYAFVDVGGLDLSGGLKNWSIAGASAIPVAGSSLRVSVDYVDLTGFMGPSIPDSFDLYGYLSRYPDVAALYSASHYAAWDHYWSYGVDEGRTDGFFDVREYLAMYGDLRAVFGSDLRAAILHWYTYGRSEGRMLPAGFDVDGYLRLNPDVASVIGGDRYAAWEHYVLHGASAGRMFDEHFVPEEYIGMYRDVAQECGMDRVKATRHWLAIGRTQERLGRVPPTFDVGMYLLNNPDVLSVIGSSRGKVWAHYVDYGVAEGRTEGDFSPIEYLAYYGDLYSAFGSDVEAAALHWFLYGRYEGRRVPAGFDVSGYLARQTDVAASLSYGSGYVPDRYGAWLHYYRYGIDEGRVFDETFRVDEYLSIYGDIRAAFGSDRRAALMHWLQYGRLEGRKGRY